MHPGALILRDKPRFMRMRSTPFSLLLTGLGLSTVFALTLTGETALPTPVSPPVVAADMKEGPVIFQNVCAACHGPNGEGKMELGSPAIAGLPDWYAKHQVIGFREGRRGHDPADAQAFLMAAIARSLSQEQIDAVIQHTSSMPLITPAEVDREGKTANIDEGRMLFQERCMECHRYNASGELAFGSPPLIGQQGWYLTAQIKKFKSGQRGAVKDDVNGAKMILSSTYIGDSDMLRDVVAYILTLNPEPEPKIQEGSPFETATR